MKLRMLKLKDAEHMLEWMHDANVVEDLSTDFRSKTIEDCKRFIEHGSDEANIHYAIVDYKGEYMGTVSLKHISREEGCAEFAIVLRTVAMGKGYSQYGMTQIMNIAKTELELKNVYWCVSMRNLRAIKFYDESGCLHTKNVPASIKQNYSEEELKKFCWYMSIL